jgi:hypothetical protein
MATIEKRLLKQGITVIDQETKYEFPFTRVRVRKIENFNGQGYGMDINAAYQIWACAKNTPNFKELVNRFKINNSVRFIDELGIVRVVRIATVDLPVNQDRINHMKGTCI